MRRWGRFPTERDWERSVVLEPRPVPYAPELVSDGAGLPFSPAALAAPAAPLDRTDPAVLALAAQLSRRSPDRDGSGPALDQWRILARTESEVLFARGVPPRMVTIVMRDNGRREGWRSLAVTQDAALRATRDGVRASNWRLDPARPPLPQDTVVRILVTEQTRSGGALADDRLLTPDLHDGDEQLVLRVYVTPKRNVQISSSVPETPVRVQLPSPVGRRQLIDGALYPPS